MVNQIRVCSLFSGSGGIDYAFEQAGCQVVWANENDRDACLTYHLNFPSVLLDRRDIRTVPAKTIPDFDILVGGFPCQPFSLLGKEEGFADKRGNLFFEIIRILDIKKPAGLFLENVANLRNHDNGNTFRVISEQLTSRGYRLKYIIANAQDYGFPQKRNRIYIVGFLDSDIAARFSFPKKSRPTKRIFDIIDRTKKAPDWCYLRPGTEQYERMNNAIRDENEMYGFVDGRFASKEGIQSSRNGIAFTLLAGMGNWHDREPIIKDDYGIRKLTPYECFMLQGYPESFSLQGIPIKSAYRQAGNTVCVPVVRQIATQIVMAMYGGEKEPTTSEKTDIPGLAVVGTVKNRKQIDVCLAHKFYHFPADLFHGNVPKAEYVALYIPRRLSGKDSGIGYVGKVVSQQIIKRYEIKEIPKRSDTLYCKLTVEEWKEFKGQYNPALTNAVTIIARDLLF